jgi:signal transduction histidine kinase
LAPRVDTSVHLHWKLKTLRSLQERLGSLYTFDQTLLETMQEALAVFRADGVLLFHNLGWQRFCEKQGMSTSISLRAVTDLMGGWPELHPIVRQTGAWQEKEAALKQGQWRIRAARLPQTAHAEGGAIMLVVEDTTARQERDRARGEALSFVTHELRTPLISIQGFAEFLMRYPERSVGSQAPATIFREARRLVAMINAYLEVLRLDVGARPIRVTPVDIVAVAKHVEQIVQPLAQTARIQLRVEKATQVRMLECDENLVSGALLNLLSNAVKYSPAESDVVLRLAASGESMELAVHNTGPSIPAQELEQLFEPFYRAAQSDSKPGWGLGLAFVKRIAEQHGGRVEVKSDSTSGTCFRILLPVKSAVTGEVVA